MKPQTTACEAGVTAAWYKYADKVRPRTGRPAFGAGIGIESTITDEDPSNRLLIIIYQYID